MNDACPEISVILPVFNEEANLPILHQSLKKALERTEKNFEIIYCDDGSIDQSYEYLLSLANTDSRIKLIKLRRNFGQTPAISAGVDHAQGDTIILMDADMQNDPEDIILLLNKLEEGYDIVSGWRKNRQDPYLTKVLPSRIANALISWLTGVKLHDHGCTLKAYRRETLKGISLYGEMHRFISIMGHWTGAKVAEVEVQHHPRTRGKTKYSISKTFRVLFDIPVLILLGTYLTRPIHFFGPVGFLSFLIAFVCGIKVGYEKIVDPLYKAHRDPVLIFAVFFMLAGIQIIMMGLLAELLTRVYHESQQKKTYVIAQTKNVSNYGHHPSPQPSPPGEGD